MLATASSHDGPIVAVDVTRYETLRPPARRFSPLCRLLTGPESGPSIVGVLLRAAHLGSEVQTRLSRDAADPVLDPPPDVDLRDWKAIDRAAESGYRCAMSFAGDLRRGAFGAPAAAPVL